MIVQEEAGTGRPPGARLCGSAVGSAPCPAPQPALRGAAGLACPAAPALRSVHFTYTNVRTWEWWLFFFPWHSLLPCLPFIPPTWSLCIEVTLAPSLLQDWCLWCFPLSSPFLLFLQFPLKSLKESSESVCQNGGGGGGGKNTTFVPIQSTQQSDHNKLVFLWQRHLKQRSHFRNWKKFILWLACFSKSRFSFFSLLLPAALLLHSPLFWFILKWSRIEKTSFLKSCIISVL